MSNGLIKPSEVFRRKIEPAFNDYTKNPLSERLANILAMAIDHQSDWTFEYYKNVDPSRLSGSSSVKAFREQLISQCPQLQVMNELADADHHRFLTRPSNPPRVVDTSTAAYSVQAGELCVPKYQATFLSEATKAIDFWRVWKD
jgi:hypothetical protein